MKMKFLFIIVLLILLQPLRAEVRLPRIFGSHMVLQRDMPIKVWGWAVPGEAVGVQLGEITQSTRANDRGEWKLALPAMKAGGPYTLTAIGSSKCVFEDVMIGEVWLCSGQSNMEMGVGFMRDAGKEIANADYPELRLMLVQNKWTPQPQNDITGQWNRCTPQTIAHGGWNGFSAVAFFFGRELHGKLGVPIGLIDADWGGTRIESWTAPEGFAVVAALKDENEKVLQAIPGTEPHRQRLQLAMDQFDGWYQSARKAMIAGENIAPMPEYPEEMRGPRDVQHATALYNGMIHPLAPFAIRGAIWYQGESNMGDGMKYAERMKALVGGWRKVWNQGDFPFYFVQIAPYRYEKQLPETEAEIWEAQSAAAAAISNVGMIVTNDIGDLADIHPLDKQTVAHRLALQALAKTYGQNNVACSGPVFKAMKIEGEQLRIQFDHAERGLASRDGQPLSWFEILDTDKGGFVKADARVDGSSVVLSSPQVKHPVAMRFAWSMLAEPNLMNADGLPAGAFRAGDVPKREDAK